MSTRLENLKILIKALWDEGYRKIRRDLLFNFVFLIDHYLNKELTKEPRIFGYDFYITENCMFTTKLLSDLIFLDLVYEKSENEEYIIIEELPYIEILEEEKDLYESIIKIIREFLKPYENNPKGLFKYILSELLKINPKQKTLYYYISAKDLIK